MKFVPCRLSESSYKRWGATQDTLLAISDSREPCVEIKGFQNKSAYNCKRGLDACIRRHHLTHLKVCVRNERVFVINTLLIKD